MDSNERRALILRLQEELETSMWAALRYSAAWRKRNAEVTAEAGGNEGRVHVAKRDDMRLKELMSSYNWHVTNSNWARNMLAHLGAQEARGDV